MLWLAWLIGLALLSWFFSIWLDNERNPNRHIEAVKGVDGATEIILQRNRSGHYVLSGAINGRQVDFLLDTGASDVNIPAGVADQLDLTRGMPLRAKTANGTITVYSTRLDEVRLGPIVVRSVAASINPRMSGSQVLLGMSVLKHLEIIQRGDRLTLRIPTD